MNKWLRYGGWAVLAIIAFWVVLKVVSIIFGVVSWIISTAISLLILAGLLYLGYLAVSKLMGGSGGSGGSRSRSREKVYE